MNENYILEILVPSFNRVERLNIILSKFKKIKNQQIGITIIDNFSDEYNASELDLNDTRIRYFRNKKNFGGPHNTIISLKYVDRAIYGIILLDRDQFDFVKIDDLFNFLVKNKPDIAYINQQPNSFNDFSFHELDRMEVMEFITFIHHPTGYIISKKLIENFSLDTSINLNISDLLQPLDLISNWAARQDVFKFYSINMALWTEAEISFLISTKSNYLSKETNVIPHTDASLLNKDFQARLSLFDNHDKNNYLIRAMHFSSLIYLVSHERLRIHKKEKYRVSRYIMNQNNINFSIFTAAKLIIETSKKYGKNYIKDISLLTHYLLVLYNLLNLFCFSLLPFSPWRFITKFRGVNHG